MRLCAYCLMPNHWHFVVWPEHDRDLPRFMQQVTNTHVKRWKEHRHELGYGHLYQGRYNCFPVETEDYFYRVVRYVERNALRARLVGSRNGDAASCDMEELRWIDAMMQPRPQTARAEAAGDLRVSISSEQPEFTPQRRIELLDRLAALLESEYGELCGRIIDLFYTEFVPKSRNAGENRSQSPR